MRTQEDYRQFTEACVRFAAQAEDRDEREIFLEMAVASTRVARLHRDAARQLVSEQDVAELRP